MKYRRLNITELKALEKEFVQFLSTNHITADDWIKIKEKKKEQVEELIGLFSDIVLGKILKKLEYLEFKTPNDIKVFHCQKEKMILMGITVTTQSNIDFTKNIPSKEIMKVLEESGSKVQIYTTEKGYNDDREAELFEMMQNGCLISKDGYLFNTLQQLKSK